MTEGRQWSTELQRWIYPGGTPAGFASPKRSALQQYGPTPLIAAMRAKVASVFGAEIELP